MGGIKSTLLPFDLDLYSLIVHSLGDTGVVDHWRIDGIAGRGPAAPYAFDLSATGAISVTATGGWPATPPGDCNIDDVVDAADVSAQVLEVFDDDGTRALDAGEGSFPGHPLGCDANSDGVVDAGDLSCTVLKVFGGESASCGGDSATQGIPGHLMEIDDAAPGNIDRRGHVAASIFVPR